MIELDKRNHWIAGKIQSVVSTQDSWKQGSNNQQVLSQSNEIKGSYRFNYHGLMLPFSQNGGDDEDPQILVKIVPHLNQPFNTKSRAPFKLVCETIRYRELQEIEERSRVQDNLFNQSPRENESNRNAN